MKIIGIAYLFALKIDYGLESKLSVFQGILSITMLMRFAMMLNEIVNHN